MNTNAILNKLDAIEQMASQTITQVTVLRKEIKGGGAALVSALTGSESLNEDIQRRIKRRQENRLKKKNKS